MIEQVNPSVNQALSPTAPPEEEHSSEGGICGLSDLSDSLREENQKKALNDNEKKK